VAIYDWELRATWKLIDDVLQLTEAERVHVVPTFEEGLYIRIEFWHGHQVIEIRVGDRTIRKYYFFRRGRWCWDSHWLWRCSFDGNVSNFGPGKIPELRITLDATSLRMYVIGGRFGGVNFDTPHPHNICVEIPLDEAKLSEFRDNDPDAWEWRPSYIRDYNTQGEFVHWRLRIAQLCARTVHEVFPG
jgi:hypothetical protein